MIFGRPEKGVEWSVDGDDKAMSTNPRALHVHAGGLRKSVFGRPAVEVGPWVWPRELVCEAGYDTYALWLGCLACGSAVQKAWAYAFKNASVADSLHPEHSVSLKASSRSDEVLVQPL